MTTKTPKRRQTGRKPATARSKGRDSAADHGTRHRSIAAVATVGTLAAGVFAAFRLGWLKPLFPNDGAEHKAPDLAADAPRPGTTRAPDAFRPDPTAPVPASEREALRPATGQTPTLVGDRGSLNGYANPVDG